jgi:hypothetical protein
MIAISGSSYKPIKLLNTIYVGKHGNDSNHGRIEDKAVLTFGAAILKAIALGPSDGNRVTLLAHGAGTFNESIVLPDYVSLLGPNIQFAVWGDNQTIITLGHDSSVTLSSIYTYGDNCIALLTNDSNTGIVDIGEIENFGSNSTALKVTTTSKINNGTANVTKAGASGGGLSGLGDNYDFSPIIDLTPGNPIQINPVMQIGQNLGDFGAEVIVSGQTHITDIINIGLANEQLSIDNSRTLPANTGIVLIILTN